MKLRCNLFLQSAAIAASFVFCMATANAVILTWDSNTSTSGAQDGGGTWTSGAGGWWNGTTNVNWASGDQAIFGAGTDAAPPATYAITVGGDITTGNGSATTGGLDFANSGYTLSAALGRTINLGSSNAVGFLRVASGKTGTIGNNVTVRKNTTSGLAFVGGGTLEIATGGLLQQPQAAVSDVTGGTTLWINGGTATFATSLVAGKFNTASSTGGGSVKIDSGALNINSNNLIIGYIAGETSSFTMNGGTVTIAGHMRSANGTATATLNGGTLTTTQIYRGGGTLDLVLNGGTIKASTSSVTDFIASSITSVTVNGGGVTIDSNGRAITASAALLGGTGSGGLTLNDTAITKGTLTLTGANTYTGTTTIQAGTLKLGTGGSIANSALVDVRSGANFDVTTAGFTLGAGKTLKGAGNVLGSVTVADTGIATGGDGTTGTLSIGSLAFSNTGTVNVGTLGNYLAAPAVNVTGALTLSGGAGAVTVNLPTAATASGTYRLLGFGSGISDANGFSLGTAPTLGPRQSGSGLQYDGTNNQITYTITAVNPIWTGAQSSEWSTNVIGGSSNWKLPDNSPTDFLVGDEVLFDDSAAIKTLDVSNGNVSPASVTFNNSSGNDYTLQGINGITGTAVLTKNGTGSVIISNANDYTGNTNINNGTLILNGSMSATAIHVAGGGTLTQGAAGSLGGTASLTTNGTTTLAGSNTNSGPTMINGGSLTISGSGTLSSNSAITLGGGTLNLGGTSQTAGEISVTAPASSGDTISNGNLTGTSYAASNNSGDAVISANLLANGSAGFTKSGTGTLTLSGTNTYAGATSVSAGTLKAGSSSTFTNVGVLSMTGTGTFDLAGFDAAFTNVSGASGNTITTSGSGTGTDTLTISGMTAASGALFTDGPTRKLALSINGTATLDPLSNSGNTFSGGLNLLNMRLGAVNNSATTGGRFGKGTITIGSGSQLYMTSAVTISNDFIVNANDTVGSRLGSVRIQYGSGVSSTLSGTINANATVAGFGSDSSTAGAILELSGKLTGTNGFSFFKSSGTNAWTVFLNNGASDNNYEGLTTIGASTTVKLGTANQIPNGTGKGNVSLTGGLDLNGLNETVNGLTGAGIIDNVSSSGTNTLTIGDGDATGTDFSGVIQNTTGTLSLIKTGIGTQILSGANTYGGTTLISAGTLQIGNGGGTGSLSSGSTITNNGTLAFNHSGTLTQGTNFAAGITGSGALTKAGSGTVVLSGTNGYLGSTTVDAGELRLASAGAISGTTIAINAGRLSLDVGVVTGSGKTVTIKGDGGNFFGALQGKSGTTEWQGNVTIGAAGTRIGVEAGQFTVSGTIDSGASAHGVTFRPNSGANLILSGSNTYLGDTSIITSSGNVRLSGGDNRLPSGTRLLFGTGTTSGILDLNGQNQQVAGLSVVGGSNNEIKSATAATLTIDTAATSPSTWAGKITGAAALAKTGPDSLTLTNENTYTGNTTISQGTLVIGAGGSIANSSTIHISTGANLDVSEGAGFTVAASQTITGNGTIIATGKTVTANGTLSPGNSPGTLVQDGGTLQLGANGNLNWQVYDASDGAGVGYDTVSMINGATLDLSQLNALTPYHINLWSLSAIAPDAGGNALNFDNTQSHSWTLFSTASAITGFNTNLFNINLGAINGTAGFGNALGGGTFGVGLADGDTDLVLNFTPIPEPRAALLGGLGLLALFRRRRS